MDNIKDLIREKACKIAKDMNLEIFDINLKKIRRKLKLEIIIDKLDGYVGIDECENFSKKIEAYLDEKDLIDSSYDLIVSSPGLDRPLRGINDYIRFKGKLAKIILRERIENRTVIKGYITKIEGNNILIKEKDGGKVLKVPYNKILRANLELDL
ncbi:ribosome maturation factor RimP [Marinitoga hydrogenitolerans DSM 16785]|uniref:Ribosome maturation factor RimP n=1 Tax=Marinitoga hydrogenitolerans (strain DSM 16785 / JCM 12826 / AT1271) TaxID=1122195 RepID=A0A1M4S4H5_MARH1|nr:ribosome maturation factor RimP [Marinitoga hydrogenitolerans]SHE27101.1 ribosome maturation factor RimP [Marinitoga hydrogenitolerans DSM 16785]